MSAFQANDESSILSARTKENRDPSDLYFLWYDEYMKMQKINRQKYKKDSSLKSKLEWTILALLILAVFFAIWSNLFTYGYYYVKCQDKPAEVFGNYYRIPYDKGYGIHPGSDYSNCSYSKPEGKTRDPSTKAGMIQAQNSEQPKANYDVYVPDGYTIIKPIVLSGGTKETSFAITTKSGTTFRVREMNKDSDFSYTNLCSKPAEENWSGTIVGNDDKGRTICRTNISKYVKNYIAGINIGRTAIMLQTSNGSEELLNSEVIAIFSSMKEYKAE